jgi:hypothetical protein
MKTIRRYRIAWLIFLNLRELVSTWRNRFALVLDGNTVRSGLNSGTHHYESNRQVPSPR